MELAEITAYLDTNKDTEEVKNYIGGLNPVTTDRANAFLSTEDGKRLLQPKLDTYHSKGLDSWRTNNLDGLVAAKVKELYPDADPKDTLMAEMKAEIALMKSDGIHKELTNKALKVATEKKLPVELMEYFIGKDEATTLSNLGKLEAVFSAHIEAIVAERLKGGYVPPSSGGAPAQSNPWKAETFNLTAQGKLYLENPALAAQLIAQAK